MTARHDDQHDLWLAYQAARVRAEQSPSIPNTIACANAYRAWRAVFLARAA